MVDYLGNEIKIGDDVIYLIHCTTSSDLRDGKIEKMLENVAVVNGKRKAYYKMVSLSALQRKWESEFQASCQR